MSFCTCAVPNCPAGCDAGFVPTAHAPEHFWGVTSGPMQQGAEQEPILSGRVEIQVAKTPAIEVIEVAIKDAINTRELAQEYVEANERVVAEKQAEIDSLSRSLAVLALAAAA